MKLSKRRFSTTPTDTFLLCVYSAPLELPLYAKSKFNNGTAAVEHSMLMITEKHGCGLFFTLWWFLMLEQLTSNVKYMILNALLLQHRKSITVIKGTETLKILMKIMWVNCFWDSEQISTYFYSKVSLMEEVTTLLFQLLLMASLIILHFCDLFHTFLGKYV